MRVLDSGLPGNPALEEEAVGPLEEAGFHQRPVQGDANRPRGGGQRSGRRQRTSPAASTIPVLARARSTEMTRSVTDPVSRGAVRVPVYSLVLPA